MPHPHFNQNGGEIMADLSRSQEPARRIRFRSKWEYFGWAIVIPPFLLVLWSAATNENFRWDIVGQYLTAPSIFTGIGVTLLLTVVSMVLGTFLGALLAVMLRSSSGLLRTAALAYVWFFRGTPLLVQLIFWFNLAALYPTLGIPGFEISTNTLITAMTAAILGLTLNEAAYMAEIVRGGLVSVNSGQTEAAESLGMRPAHILVRVTLPQAMRVIVPMIGNQTIAMLKNTSLVSVLGVSELLHSAQIIYGRTYQTIPLLIVACIWYLAMTTILTVGQSYIEKAFNKGYGRAGSLAVVKISPLETGTVPLQMIDPSDPQANVEGRNKE